MSTVVGWVQSIALGLGAPGLFVIAFLDSSFLSLPEVADIMVVYMVVQHPARLLVYIIATTAGSMGGCLVIYLIGRKGGEAMVRRRFAGPAVERAMRLSQRYGIMAVLVPSLLPPPMPFKIFVLLSGVARISVRKFVLAIAIGRGTRYTVLGLLAIEYGQAAMAYLRENGTLVSLVAAGVLLAGFALYVIWGRAQRSKGR
ncbi:MAG: DedA family protein [Acidobacteria bacterium]|nr:DedA family protein [Acidobacteriota bacterium]